MDSEWSVFNSTVDYWNLQKKICVFPQRFDDNNIIRLKCHCPREILELKNWLGILYE